VALITDGRFSGALTFLWWPHHPEAYVVAAGAVKNGDILTIDAEKRELRVEISVTELKARQKKFKAPKPRYTRVSWRSTRTW